MTKKQKKLLFKIIVSAVLFAAAALTVFFLNVNKYVALTFFLPAFLTVGIDVIKKSALNIIHGEIFDENFLMSIAGIGAFLIGEYPEAVAVMLLYQVGELFQSLAVSKSRKSISALMDIRPDVAYVEKNGEIVKTSPSDVKVGDIIVIKPGDKIPLDAQIIKGKTDVDASAITGESLFAFKEEGDELISGTINITSTVYAAVEKPFEESTASKILKLVENSSETKAKSENFITKFASVYTPAVVISALLISVVPAVFFNQNAVEWVNKALSFLVVSCPCALVVSVPLGFFCAMGRASKDGILVKGANFLELLSKTKSVVFDKTGTLTQGNFEVVAIHPDKISEKELLEYAALCESFSNHPISKSLLKAYGKKVDLSRIEESGEIPSMGAHAKIDGKKVFVGSGKYMKSLNINYHECSHAGTIVHVAVDGEYAGHIVISDEIKKTSEKAVGLLKKSGITKTVMLTGDIKKIGESVAERLKIDEVFCELTPDGKVQKLGEIKSQNNGGVLFVGDGVNDAPVLCCADVGISMGTLGSDAAVEAADVVLMDDDPLKIVSAIKISKRAMNIARQNIIFAISFKLLTLVLTLFKITDMWFAVIADVGVLIIAILNAMRIFAMKKER